jgi:PAS domain S-box-containing protein
MNFAIYREEIQELNHRRTFYITLVGGFLTMLFGFLDYIVVPEHFHEFLDYRIAVAILSVVLFVANYFDRKQLYPALIGFTEYLLISLILLLIIYRMDGGDSPYYVGLLVAMTIYSTLATLTAVQTILSGLFIVFCYAITIQLSSPTGGGFSLDVLGNLFFMICFVFIVATQSWAETKARQEEFQLRQQELDANEELSRHVAILEEEVRKRTLLQAATEERYHQLFDQVADDVVVLTSDARILRFNQLFAHHYLDDGVDKVTSFFQIVTLSDQKTFENLIANTLTSGKFLRSCSLTLIKSDGSTCETELNISLVTRNRESLGVLLVIRDISTRRQLEKRLFKSLKLKKQTENAAIMSLAKLSEFRDVTPKNHLERIREYCRILALQLSRQKYFRKTISPDFIQDIYHAAILHDIGKVSIPDAFWNKHLSLTEEEEAKIRSHTLVGGNVIEQMEGQSQEHSFLSMAKDIAYFHHEQWDGNGYPYGLKEEEIPLAARIVAVADAYEELTTDCNRQDAVSHEKAIEEIMKNIKIKFDPSVAEALFLRQEEFGLIRKKFTVA